jgi:hypothetical protein
MKINLIFITILTAFFSFLFSCNSKTDKKFNKNHIEETFFPVKLGDSIIVFKTYIFGAQNIIYFNLHDDENTSVEAAKHVLNNTHAKLIEIQASGERLITFNIDTTVYKFDPNRIFSSHGREATLKRYSQFSQKADSIVKSFADYITDSLLKDAKIIVTLHNNTENNYSILSYAQGGEYETDAADIYINKNQDSDDFFYVTQDDYFNKIKKKAFNVLLQDNTKVTDDGSLSVFCGNKHIRYINIEAQKGHLKQQEEMIMALQSIVNKTKNKDTEPEL